MKFLLKLLKMFFKIKRKRSSRIVIPAPKKREKVNFSKILNEAVSKKRKDINAAVFTRSSYNRTMVLVLDRIWYTEKSTVGALYIDGKYECFILEDSDRLKKNRRKVYGETAIPRGTYEIRLNYSRKFKRILPLLSNVPGFSGIRIHAGNTARDTEGCLLPGVTRGTNSVGQSKRAFKKLYKKLERAKSDNKKIIIKIDPL